MDINSVYEAPHIEQVIKCFKAVMSMSVSNQRKVTLSMHKYYYDYYFDTLAALKEETISQ